MLVTNKKPRRDRKKKRGEKGFGTGIAMMVCFGLLLIFTELFLLMSGIVFGLLLQRIGMLYFPLPGAQCTFAVGFLSLILMLCYTA